MKRRLNEVFIILLVGLLPLFYFWDELDRVTGSGLWSLLAVLAYVAGLRAVAEWIGRRMSQDR